MAAYLIYLPRARYQCELCISIFLYQENLFTHFLLLLLHSIFLTRHERHNCISKRNELKNVKNVCCAGSQSRGKIDVKMTNDEMKYTEKDDEMHSDFDRRKCVACRCASGSYEFNIFFSPFAVSYLSTSVCCIHTHRKIDAKLQMEKSTIFL